MRLKQKLKVLATILFIISTTTGCGDVLSIHNVDDIFNYFEEYGTNYHLSITYTCYQSDTYLTIEEIVNTTDDDLKLHYGYMVDAYYMENAVVFFYDLNVEDDNGFDGVEIYFNNKKEDKLDYYQLFESDGNNLLYLVYSFEKDRDEPTRWQDLILNLGNLINDRDLYTNSNSSDSDEYINYKVTNESVSGLFYSLFYDNYIGKNTSFATEEYFFYYLENNYPEVKEYYDSFCGNSYDINTKAVTSRYYQNKDNLWQVTFNDLCDEYYFLVDIGRGKTEHIEYMLMSNMMSANISDVGKTHLPKSYIKHLDTYYSDL